jgi:hypothetical protein
MARKRKGLAKAKSKNLKDQISELKEEIRQLQETVGMLVSIVMEGMEEEESAEPKNQDEEFTFYN